LVFTPVEKLIFFKTHMTNTNKMQSTIFNREMTENCQMSCFAISNVTKSGSTITGFTITKNKIMPDYDLLPDELVSKYPNIPNLNMKINKIATHSWGKCTFISYSQIKTEYQVDDVPMSHWGIKDALIIGGCPVPARVCESNKEYIKRIARRTLDTLINRYKITTFMSLMAECDDENGNEHSEYRPYSKLDLPEINPTVKFFKLEIKDCNVTDDNLVLEFARKIVGLLQSGEKIYLHCWGGHGRAGTVYCLVLHLLYGMNTTDVLNYCQRVHDCRDDFMVVSSPQTTTQAMQVRRIIESLD
jgi:protein-tyrosine phosphatase